MAKKELLFSIEPDLDGKPIIYLHINDTVIIPFEDIGEWNTFKNDMQGMTMELVENLDTRNY